MNLFLEINDHLLIADQSHDPAARICFQLRIP